MEGSHKYHDQSLSQHGLGVTKNSHQIPKYFGTDIVAPTCSVAWGLVSPSHCPSSPSWVRTDSAPSHRGWEEQRHSWGPQALGSHRWRNASCRHMNSCPMVATFSPRMCKYLDECIETIARNDITGGVLVHLDCYIGEDCILLAQPAILFSFRFTDSSDD